MPRIIYDADKTIDLEIGPESMLTKSVQIGNIQYSGGGRYEAINQYCYDELLLDVRFNEDIYRQLYSFWYFWARHRRMFALAMSTSRMVSTTLDGSAASGQKVIPLDATTGLSATDNVIIRSATTFARQKIAIDSVSAGVSITVDQNLLDDYVEDDVLMHDDYFPFLICTDDDFEPLRSGTWYSHTFGLREAYSVGYLNVDEGVLEL
jgi:hypothetical protein